MRLFALSIPIAIISLNTIGSDPLPASTWPNCTKQAKADTTAKRSVKQGDSLISTDEKLKYPSPSFTFPPVQAYNTSHLEIDTS
ncbi:hypothetical protein DTO271D3_7164 [Paecilomyces variotii]|nr:hypothetical protein DTO271D3_7164 [Paecilomyces variotii]